MQKHISTETEAAKHDAWMHLQDARAKYEKERTLENADRLLIRATNLLLAVSECDEFDREMNGWRA